MMMMTTMLFSSYDDDGDADDDEDDNDDDDDDNVKEEKVGVVLYAPGPTQVTTGTQVCSCYTLHCTCAYRTRSGDLCYPLTW